MKNVSEVTGKTYTVEDMVRIVNPKQAATYMANGAMPLDIYPSDFVEDKTQPPDYRLVYFFNRNETRDLFRRWCNHSLGRPEGNDTVDETGNKEN